MHPRRTQYFQAMIRDYIAIREIKPLLSRLLTAPSTLGSGLDLIEKQLDKHAVGGNSVTFGKRFRTESQACANYILTDESKAAFCSMVIDLAFAMVDTPEWHLQAAAREHCIVQLHSLMDSSQIQLAS